MPYIQTMTNTEINEEQRNEIKRRLGEAIRILGKTEDWLMVEFVPNCNLYFKGDNSNPISYVEVKLYGRSDASSYNNMTREITNILTEILGIPAANIYVSYGEYSNWGWNGNNF